jgi:hypothetical protein
MPPKALKKGELKDLSDLKTVDRNQARENISLRILKFKLGQQWERS